MEEFAMGMPMNCCMSMPMMKMSFFFGYQSPLLFKSFSLQSPGQLFGGILLVMVVAILYEGLKTLRELIASREAKKEDAGQGEDAMPLVVNQKSKKSSPLRFFLKEYCSLLHFLQSWLHVVQVGVAYLLMLVAMTFNGWLFLAVCFGAGIGYFVFGKCRKSFADFRSQSEHCH